MFLYILFFCIVLYFLLFKKETFDNTSYTNIIKFLNDQYKQNPSGDYQAFLKFLDSIKNKNFNIERLNNYYYLFGKAKTSTITESDIDTIMKSQ